MVGSYYHELKRNHIALTIPELPKQFEVEFDFQGSARIGGWSSILHMTTGKDTGWGGRIPFFVGANTKINPAFSISGNWNKYFSTPVFPLHKWIHYKANQVREGDTYVYRVFQDGKQLQQETNTKPQVFKNVQVWLSDPWYNAQPGFVKNVVIRSESMSCL